MTKSLDKLNNIRSLRVAAREYAIEELKSMLSKFTIVVEEIQAEYEEQQEKEQLKNERLKELASSIKEEGIDVEQLIASLSKNKPAGAKRAKREPQYQYEVDSEIKYWTGQGRTPKPIQEALNNGASLEDFKIKE